MRARDIIAGTICLLVIAAVVSAFVFAALMSETEREFREEGAELNAFEMAAVDVTMWWNVFGWIVAPAAILGALVYAVLMVCTGPRTRGVGPIGNTQ